MTVSLDIPELAPFLCGTSTYTGTVLALTLLLLGASANGAVDAGAADQPLATGAARDRRGARVRCRGCSSRRIARPRRSPSVAPGAARPEFGSSRRGPHLATAEYGVAKLVELSRVPAWSDDIEEFAHRQFWSADPRDLIVYLAPNETCSLRGRRTLRSRLRSWASRRWPSRADGHAVPTATRRLELPATPEWLAALLLPDAAPAPGLPAGARDRARSGHPRASPRRPLAIPGEPSPDPAGARRHWTVAGTPGLPPSRTMDRGDVLTIGVVGYLSLDEIVVDGVGRRGVPGGAALYAALGALAGGVRVLLGAACGSDFPEAVLDTLAAMGVDLSAVVRRDHPDAAGDARPRSGRPSRIGSLRPGRVARGDAGAHAALSSRRTSGFGGGADGDAGRRPGASDRVGAGARGARGRRHQRDLRRRGTRATAGAGPSGSTSSRRAGRRRGASCRGSTTRRPWPPRRPLPARRPEARRRRARAGVGRPSLGTPAAGPPSPAWWTRPGPAMPLWVRSAPGLARGLDDPALLALALEVAARAVAGLRTGRARARASGAGRRRPRGDRRSRAAAGHSQGLRGTSRAPRVRPGRGRRAR